MKITILASLVLALIVLALSRETTTLLREKERLIEKDMSKTEVVHFALMVLAECTPGIWWLPALLFTAT